MIHQRRDQPLDSIRGRMASVRSIPERRNETSRAQLLDRVRAEFREMPCLRLTLPQATRLFGVREDVCRRVLQALAADGLLARGADGQYACRRRA